MKSVQRPSVNTIAAFSLLSLGTWFVPAIASANPTFIISKLLPKKTDFDCGTVGAITLTRDQKDHDRFTYNAVNSRGQTLTIKRGVGYGDDSSDIYTFVARDGSEFIIEKFRNGTATLTTSGKNNANSTTFDCKVMKAPKKRSGGATR
jgi:hypothetical protein